MLRFEWWGQTLELDANRALLWMEQAAIVMTDPHFGKGASFRHHGVPLPPGSTQADILRLTALMRVHEPERLYILGDFFHTAESRDEETLEALAFWRAEFSEVEVTLVRGNHDRHAGDPPPELAIHVVEDGHRVGPFEMRHAPREDGQIGEEEEDRLDVYTLAGHVHPSVKVRGAGLSAFRAPCFRFGRRTALLPAFGSFTGMANILPAEDDRIFAVGPDEVVELPVAGVRYLA